MVETKETVAELQARRQKLEQKAVELKAKTDVESKAELRAVNSEVSEIDAKISLQQRDEKIVALEASEKKRIENQADDAVAQMINTGAIPVRDTELQASWKEKFIKDPSIITMVVKGQAPRDGALGGQLTKTGTAGGLEGSDNTGVQLGFSLTGALKRMMELQRQNAAVAVSDPESRTEDYRRKGRLAMEAAAIYKTELAPNMAKWEHCSIRELGKLAGLDVKSISARHSGISIQAADYSDPGSNSTALGVLSGTLVLMRTLPFFAYKYPELMNLYTDFSDTPGLLNQTETTRIVVQPAVQKYATTLDSAGRPNGWSTVSKAQTTDVSLTLTDYIAVPIVFGNNLLASTVRKIFDEQSVLAVKAIAAYFVNMVTNLVTSANYNAYAVSGVNGVPAGVTYPTYVSALPNFSMSDLDTLDAIFTNGKVPEEDRGIMLTPSYYSKLRGDPRLEFFYAASSKGTAPGEVSDFLSEARLPKLSGFAPYKAPYLPSSTPSTNSTTNNVVGWAFQKAGAIVKSRLPQDFTQALGVMIPGSVTTVTDPDTKISLMLVQYVNLTQGYAEWRPEVMLGAALGDPRAGLVITSQ